MSAIVSSGRVNRAIGALALAATLFVPAAPSAAREREDAPIRVEVVRSEAASRPVSVRLRGATEASRRVSAAAQISGLVVSTPLRRGSVVAAGDLLCRIEPADRPARLAEARAALAKAQSDADASDALRRRGFSAEAAVAEDRAALERAKAEVAARKLDLERTEIRAPFAGQLEKDAAETGALLQPGDLCAEIIALDPIHGVAYASEAEVAGVAVGQNASLRLRDGRVVAAAVTFVAETSDPATRTFRVDVAAPNPRVDGSRIREGAAAEIIIATGAAPAHRAPRSALTLDDAGRLGVKTLRDGVVRFAPTTVVDDGPDGVWIVGLAPSVDIIVTGQAYVADGARAVGAPRGGARRDVDGGDQQ